ncbi:MAG: hypothetical protein P8179_04420 [Candidatus Thiodiazotropha sp.]
MSGIESAQQSCPAEPTTPDCQQDTDNAMDGLIDSNRLAGLIRKDLKTD